MIKAILFDADGVVIKRHKYFSERLAEEFSVAREKTMPFFRGVFVQCVLGRADLKEEVAKYLYDWKWKRTVDELLEYWFSGEREVDTKLLKYIDEIRTSGIHCYLVTDQEKYRAEYILNAMGLGEHFDGAFFSCGLGYRKSDREFFEEVLKKISNVEPGEVLYFDDDEKNIAVAGAVEISAKLYMSFENFKNSDENNLLKKSC